MLLLSSLAVCLLLNQAAGQLREIFRAPDGQLLENIAVRRNGDVLFNPIGGNATYILSFAGGRETITQLPALPSVLGGPLGGGLFGIAEINDDVFIVSGGAIPGSISTWAYDFNKNPVAISKVADIPEASLLNGAAAIPPQRRGQNGTVLFSDTVTGEIYHIDPTSGTYATIFRTEAASSDPPPAFVRSGVNGIEYVPSLGRLFFANSGPALNLTTPADFGSVKLNINYKRSPLPEITTAGPADSIAPSVAIDDFAITSRGTAYAGNLPDQLVQIERDGTITTLIADNPDFFGPSSAAFGRRRNDRNTLYITSLGDFVNGRLYAYDLPKSQRPTGDRKGKGKDV